MKAIRPSIGLTPSWWWEWMRPHPTEAVESNREYEGRGAEGASARGDACCRDPRVGGQALRARRRGVGGVRGRHSIWIFGCRLWRRRRKDYWRRAAATGGRRHRPGGEPSGTRGDRAPGGGLGADRDALPGGRARGYRGDRGSRSQRVRDGAHAAHQSCAVDGRAVLSVEPGGIPGGPWMPPHSSIGPSR